MGYVPPRHPYEPTSTMSTLACIFDVGSQFLVQAGARVGVSNRDQGYRRYVRDLYGAPTRDWFMVANYGLLGSCIALLLSVAWALVT